MFEAVAAICSLLTLGGSDIDRLGSNDYRTREAAEKRLRLLAPFQWVPLSSAAAHSESQEVRDRARRTLAPWRSLWADLEAAAVLVAPWPVEPWAFYGNEGLRLRVQRICRGMIGGERWVSQWAIDSITPDDAFDMWRETLKPFTAADALRKVKQQLGTEQPWIFERWDWWLWERTGKP